MFTINYRFPSLESLLLMAIPIAEVPTPNLLAVSAMDSPISRFRQYAILPLSSDILLPRMPPHTSCSFTPASLHISFMTRSIDLSFLLLRICRAMPSSASRITACTKSPLPSIRLSWATSSPLPRRDNTLDHPPILRTNPPPIKSGLRPNPSPSPINFRYARIACLSSLPNCFRTYPLSCHWFCNFPTITPWPLQGYLSNSSRLLTSPPRRGFK